MLQDLLDGRRKFFAQDEPQEQESSSDEKEDEKPETDWRTCASRGQGRDTMLVDNIKSRPFFLKK